MNQYQAQNAAFKIDGYYMPPRDGQVERAFNSARAECLLHLRAAVAHVEQLELAQFLKSRKGAACARATGPNGEPCGLTQRPCPDCGLALHDVPGAA